MLLSAVIKLVFGTQVCLTSSVGIGELCVLASVDWEGVTLSAKKVTKWIDSFPIAANISEVLELIYPAENPQRTTWEEQCKCCRCSLYLKADEGRIHLQTPTRISLDYSIMMLMKFSDLSQSDRSNLVMWQVKDPCPRHGWDGGLTREKCLS